MSYPYQQYSPAGGGYQSQPQMQQQQHPHQQQQHNQQPQLSLPSPSQLRLPPNTQSDFDFRSAPSTTSHALAQQQSQHQYQNQNGYGYTNQYQLPQQQSGSYQYGSSQYQVAAQQQQQLQRQQEEAQQQRLQQQQQAQLRQQAQHQAQQQEQARQAQLQQQRQQQEEEQQQRLQQQQQAQLRQQAHQQQQQQQQQARQASQQQHHGLPLVYNNLQQELPLHQHQSQSQLHYRQQQVQPSPVSQPQQVYQFSPLQQQHQQLPPQSPVPALYGSAKPSPISSSRPAPSPRLLNQATVMTPPMASPRQPLAPSPQIQQHRQLQQQQQQRQSPILQQQRQSPMLQQQRQSPLLQQQHLQHQQQQQHRSPLQNQQPLQPRAVTQSQSPPQSTTSRPNSSRAPAVRIPSVTPMAQTKPSVKDVVTPTATTANNHTDLLICLTETYLKAAYEKSPSIARGDGDDGLDVYYRLVGMALACLEALLKKKKLKPRMEAIVRLRFASVLHEETENFDLAEGVLTKGIALAERNRFVDLKYNMQHLLARMIFLKRPKAALKSLDEIIKDVEAYEQISWVYAFRFLRVSMSLELATHPETLAALSHLRSISKLATSRGDTAILVTAAVLEAQCHLRSTQNDAIEQAQRALALARSRQFDNSVTHSAPQMLALACLLDLTCSLEDANTKLSSAQMNSLHESLDKAWKDTACWNADGSFAIPIPGFSSQRSTNDHLSGAVETTVDGVDKIAFHWIPRQDVYVLSYLLSGAAVNHKNSSDGHKAEKFFTEGLNALEDESTLKSPAESAASASRRHTWRSTVSCYLRVHRAFALCARSEWELARSDLDRAQSLALKIGANTPSLLLKLIAYLRGTIDQATGHLASAAQIYQSPDFDLPHKLIAYSDPELDIALLARLNLILVFRQPSHAQHYKVDHIIAGVEPYCTAHPNKNIRAAFFIVKATASDTDAIVRVKQFLQNSLQAANSIPNTHLTGITLNLMSYRFFRGVVGDQAEKSARAGLKLAKSGGDAIWECVAEEMFADTLEVQGKREEANVARENAYALAASIVPGLEAARLKTEGKPAEHVAFGGL